MSSNPSLATAAFRASSQQERGLHTSAQCMIALKGRLDVAKLQAALNHAVSKYEILRTVLRRQTGIKLPFQVIQETAPPNFEETKTAGIEELLQQQRRILSSVAEGPVLHAVLAATGPEQHALVLTLPVFCADAATLKNLRCEIATSYGDGAASEDVMQYADLVEWQKELLVSDETRAGREFWRDCCRNIDFASLEMVSLPLEKKTDAGFSLESYSLKTSAQIEASASALKTSTDNLLLAAWNALLFRLGGQQELTVGCEFDGRRYAELESALGPLARALPLRTSFKPEMPFKKLLEQVQLEVEEARNWQESFSWSEAGSAETEALVLPFAFAYHDLGGQRTFGDVTFSLERVRVISERFKLWLCVVRRETELELEFHYDASRLERGPVERIAGYYQNLLTAAVANPATPVSRLPLLAEPERQQLLVEWNQTAAGYPESSCLHELFEQQAGRTPERMAVRCGEQTLTYRELNEQANQLAHYLRQQGVGPDRPVGLCLERSAKTMVAVLAILKAGGAYVPLNPDNPPARLQQQLEGAAALLTETKLIGHMPAFAGPVLALDRDRRLWASQPKSNPACHTTPENLVYVIYTSGSTGVPKGVAVRHRNLVNYADFISKRLDLDQYPEGLQFADYLSKHPVDVLKIVPSHLQALVNSLNDDAAELLPRKYLILGGETLTPKLVEKIETLNPGCEILNHYGPTETTVGSLTLKLKEYDWRNPERASIPIGCPIQNTQVYILDANLESVPIGVTGELYIAGAGVTAGYLGQAEKTAERFLKNPFVGDANAAFGSKMYRTGDRARYGEDGKIEFLGRGDDQVKIRGFRIELGEIEAVLARHAAVKQVVALAREDGQGDKRLLAYVVPKRASSSVSAAATEVTGESLRAYLKQELPDYMVPQAIVVLPKLPLNANGKIDRHALPEPEQLIQTKTYVAPRTPTEQTIAEIWAEVLRREKNTIGAEDNFFDLGGHSLLATQVVSRIRRILNIELPLRTLFESPTVATLALQAEKTETSKQPEIPPLVRAPRDKPLPLSFAQQRLWVLHRMEPNNPLYNIPRAVRLKGDLTTKTLVDSLNEIIRRHESQRTTFATAEDGQPVQVIAEPRTLDVPVTDLSSQPEAERESAAKDIAAKEARTPFDLSKGPLLRATILKLGQQDHVLLLTMHHIVSDAWSAAIFSQELCMLYTAFLEGKPSPLPELAIQYGDYAAWQRNFLKGKVLEGQISYWREHLKGAPPLLQLPSDRPRPEIRKFDGAYEPIPLRNDAAESVKTFSQGEGVTPFMTLLAAFKALLARYSGQEHIVLGTDIANRTTAETERLIGFFINLLPLHTDLSGDPSFRELVSRTREVALGAYAHQDIPFDKLVEDLQPERSLSHNPIVQALFVMQNVPAQRDEYAGLELSLFPVPITRSKFDVAVFMQIAGAEMIAHWVYSTELFERSTILRMAGHFENLLRHAVTQS